MSKSDSCFSMEFLAFFPIISDFGTWTYVLPWFSLIFPRKKVCRGGGKKPQHHQKE